VIGGGPDYDDWAERLHEAGLMCVGWPKEYGGRGFGGVEVAVMNEEFGRAGLPRATRGMGEWLVGPSIIVHGTEDQKAHFLSRIVDGTDRYCQGFSEPDAGSDLAGLTTRGIVDGDEIVVTGQKVWTSGAHRATMMFCLCSNRSRRAEAPGHLVRAPAHDEARRLLERLRAATDPPESPATATSARRSSLRRARRCPT